MILLIDVVSMVFVGVLIGVLLRFYISCIEWFLSECMISRCLCLNEVESVVLGDVSIGWLCWRVRMCWWSVSMLWCLLWLSFF